MHKRRSRGTINIDSPSKLKQLNITDYFNNSKLEIIIKSRMKKKLNRNTSSNKIPAETVVILDSDSDFEDSICLPKSKPRLPFPLSDDDSTQETSSFPESVSANQKKSGLMRLNKPWMSEKENTILPDATSTPCKMINQTVKKLEDDTMNESSSSSDETVICDTLSPIKILDNNVDHSEIGRNVEDASSKKRLIDVTKTLCETPMKKGKRSNNFHSLEKKIKLHLTDNGGSGKIKKKIPEIKIESHSTNRLVEENYDASKSRTNESISDQSNSSERISPFRVKLRKELFDISKVTASSSHKFHHSSARIEDTAVAEPSSSVPTSSPAKQKHETLKDVTDICTAEEDAKLNFNNLNAIKELLKLSIENIEKRRLLFESEIDVIEQFFTIDVNYQYFIMKLYLFLPKWYNLTKFCKQIKLDQEMSEKDIIEMYEYLRDKNIIHSDVKSLDTDELLDMLHASELKKIAGKFRLGKKINNKQEIIKALKQNCRTQSTLSFTKSTEDFLKDELHKCLGSSVKLKEDIRKIITKVYLLQVFPNSLYTDPQTYLKDVGYLKVVYPDYSVENYCPFENRDEYLKYFEAVLLKKEFLNSSDKNDFVNMKKCCDMAFEGIKNMKETGRWPRHVPDYLQRFSAEYQFISILKMGAKMIAKFHESVKNWLEFLIAKYNDHFALGFWFKQLAHISSHYLKDYETAAQIVIEAFELNKTKNIFDPVQIQDLSTLASKLRNTKSFKLRAKFCDQLASLAEIPVKDNQFPSRTIKGQTDRSNNKSKRRIYSFTDENNEENFGNVENIVLNYYKIEENYMGIHCEGRLLSALFVLFFWDVIYYYYVPNTFISNLQHAPLDMFSELFYKNRQSEIDKLLEDIAHNWSEEHIEEMLRENWNNHSHEETITNFKIVDDFDTLIPIIKCIDRVVLSKMFERLAKNYKRFHSGLPDLFLWNVETSKCKFVEVKGENDKLSLKQMLWIQFMMDIGADVEVCHVSGVGARKIT